MQGVNNRGNWGGGEKGYMGTVLPAQFFSKPKTVLKNKVFSLIYKTNQKIRTQ